MKAGAHAVIFNQSGRLLVVKSPEKEHWTLPGGGIDPGESPRDACLREVAEEIGLMLDDARFLACDWRPDNDSLQFVFHCGTLTKDQVSRISLQKEEIETCRFIEPGTDLELLSPHQEKRLRLCLFSDGGLYMEGGQTV